MDGFQTALRCWEDWHMDMYCLSVIYFCSRWLLRDGLENEDADATGCPTAEWQVQRMGAEEEISGASAIPLALSSRILLPFCLAEGRNIWVFHCLAHSTDPMQIWQPGLKKKCISDGSCFLVCIFVHALWLKYHHLWTAQRFADTRKSPDLT